MELEGFGYCPAEGILIHRYLRSRCAGASNVCPIETEEDVYTKHPRQLIGKYPHMGEHGWYFFTHRFVENQGQWRTCGKKDFVFYKGERVGSKQVLEFFEGGERTKYKIIEYILEGNKMELESKRICNRREPSLGFVFRPADGILLDYYLRNRCTGKATGYCPIETEVDVYAKDPRQLIGMHPHMGERVWYFFTPSFVENQGQWRTSGKKDFVFYKGRKVGSKQVLEFFEGGQRTKYKVIEYNLERDKKDVCVCKLYEDGSLCSCVESTLKEEPVMATTRKRKISLSTRSSLRKKFKKADGAPASVENITFECVQDLTRKCNELRQRYLINQASLEEYYEAEQRLYWLWKAFLEKTELENSQIELQKWQKGEEGYQSLGFIFRPTEGFLVGHYLRNAILDELMEGLCPIYRIEFFKYHPRDLTEIYPHNGKNAAYFFSHCFPDTVNQGANDQGHWRISGRKRKSAVYHEGKKVGNKLLLEYFEGDQKTKYKVIQYKLEPDLVEFCVYKLYEDETLCSCEKSIACSLRRSVRKLCA